MKALRLFLALAVVVLGSGGAFLLFWPWLMEPVDPRIETRWKQLVEWSAPLDAGVEAGNERLGADPAKARAALAAAVAALGPARVDVESLVHPEGKVAVVERDALPEAARAALDSLRAWDAAGGAVRADPCADTGTGGGDAIAMLTLVRTSIAVAHSPSDPDLLAGLRLSRAIRRNGSLLESTVGASLWKTFAETANARRWPATEPLGLLRPRAEELFAAVARDAVCVDRMIPASEEATAARPWRLRLLGARGTELFLRREQRLFREWHSARLGSLYAKREDIDAIASALRAPDRDALPASAVLRATMIDGGSIAGQWKEAIAADQLFFKEGADRAFTGPITHEADAIGALRRVWNEYLVTVLGPVPPAPASGASPFSARREVCRTEAARVLETLGRPAIAAHTVDGGIDSVERDGDCWSILVAGDERSGGVLGVLDADDGSALLVWRVPEG